MKNLKFILYIFFISSIFSCSNEIEEEVIPSVSMECSISGIISKSTNKSISRSTTKSAINTSVPDFIAGITLIVENLDYAVKDATRTLYFDSMSDDIKIEEQTLSVKLNDIVVGRNNISAKGICKNDPINKVYNVSEKFDASNLNVRASQYADYLMKIHPMYANYFSQGEIIKQITSENNDVSVPMTSDSHRFAVVLENSSDSKYLLKVTIEDNSGNVILGPDDFIGVGKQIAMVINNDDAKGDKTYRVNVKCFSKNSKIEFPEYQKEKTINVGERVSSTKLYVFSKDKLLESEGDFSFNWELMEEIDSGEFL